MMQPIDNVNWYIQHELDSAKKPAEIVASLVDNGWQQVQAQAAVNKVAYQLQSTDASSKHVSANTQPPGNNQIVYMTNPFVMWISRILFAVSSLVFWLVVVAFVFYFDLNDGDQVAVILAGFGVGLTVYIAALVAGTFILVKTFKLHDQKAPIPLIDKMLLFLYPPLIIVTIYSVYLFNTFVG